MLYSGYLTIKPKKYSPGKGLVHTMALDLFDPLAVEI